VNVGVAATGLGLGCVLAVAFLAGLFARPTVMLARVESQITALRSEVNGYRMAHQSEMASLDRRLLGLEETAARAANELRMASGQLLQDRASATAGGGPT
jgi:hypothetical protein